MKVRSSLSALSILLLSVLGWGLAHAESQYGYSTTGTGNVSATAKLNISIRVPKVVLLKVGTAGTTIDEVSFAARVSVPTGGTPALVNGADPEAGSNNQNIAWNGTIPTVTVPTATGSIGAAAWTNGSAVTVRCSAADFATGGPTLADITVATASGGVPHPSTALGDCASATPAPLTAGQLYTGNWTFTLSDTNAVNWAAGLYTTQVTYTAADF